MTKPDYLFDRDTEWNALVTFASRTAPTAMLGIVSGGGRLGPK
ncbi:hypothetical protein [Nocardia sp. NPDC058497]